MDNGFGVNFIAYIINQCRSPPPGLILRRRGKDSESLLQPIQAAADHTRQCLETSGFPVPAIVRAQHEGGDAGRGSGSANGVQKMAKVVENRQQPLQASEDSQRSCRPPLPQRGSLETANFGRSDGISSLGGDEPGPLVRRCKGFDFVSTFILGSLHHLLKQKLKDVVLWVPGE